MSERSSSKSSPYSAAATSRSSFIGRERDIATAVALLQHAHQRLLTFTGPGGVGKTRLAQRVADEMRGRFDGRVWFVPLASTTDPRLVLPAIGQALNLTDIDDGQLGHRIRHALNTPSLLVLDNLEQITGVAPDLADLLTACPVLTLIVTSRIPLRISGEQEFAVSPLTLPDSQSIGSLDQFTGFDAVALFLQRSQAVNRTFTLTDANAPTVAELCRRLDGIPLAIELAAARSKVLSPHALLARLHNRLDVLSGGPVDAPPRLRTMSAAIGWSYDLLSTEEQTIFRRLAAFTGGFTEETVEDVCHRLDAPGSSDTAFPIFETIASLVDKSLIESDGQSPGRFRMLETIRVYGIEQLALNGEESIVREAHATLWLARAEQFGRVALTFERQRWLSDLERDHDNLRAAFQWFAETGQHEKLLRLTNALTWFWYFRGHLREGRQQTERALAVSETVATPIRAETLRCAARLATGSSNGEQARAWGEESLRLYRELRDEQAIGATLSTLAALAEHRGDDRAAADLYEASWQQLRVTGPEAQAINALNNVCDCAYRLGDIDRAEVIAHEALSLARKLGDLVVLTIALGNLGQVAVSRGETVRANDTFREGLSIAVADQHDLAAADHLVGLAAVAAQQGSQESLATAARWFATVDRMIASTGLIRVLHHRLSDTTLTTVRRALPDEIFNQAWAEGSVISLSQAIAEAQHQDLISRGESSPTLLATRSRGRPRSTFLSDRELDVLRLLIAGNTDRQIAEILSISPRTAQVHVGNILAKLGVPTRVAAVAVALRDQLVLPDPLRV